MKILALDNLQKVGLEVFAKEGIEVDVKGKMTPGELSAVIDNYDGVVVRGATKATAVAFEKVSRLKVIGRAGSGTDNIDKVAATKKRGVVERALGLKMVVIGYDPYVSREDAGKLGVELVPLDDLYKRSDFITFHTPLTPETKNMVCAASIAKMKKGVYLIN